MSRTRPKAELAKDLEIYLFAINANLLIKESCPKIVVVLGKTPACLVYNTTASFRQVIDT